MTRTTTNSSSSHADPQRSYDSKSPELFSETSFSLDVQDSLLVYYNREMRTVLNVDDKDRCGDVYPLFIDPNRVKNTVTGETEDAYNLDSRVHSEDLRTDFEWFQDQICIYDWVLEDLDEEGPPYLAKSSWFIMLPAIRMLRCAQHFVRCYANPIAHFLLEYLRDWSELNHDAFVEREHRSPLPTTEEILDTASLHYCDLFRIAYLGSIPDHPILVQYLAQKGKVHLLTPSIRSISDSMGRRRRNSF
ncbi:hypothetical protein VNI00_015552 [Paramarasmius palmivorus]|uniref:Uncharacterized protein n=1 Tax=Paramarasmius palmivorus TaxID=297713 RepID=A0AAW0BKL7_9AGAR